MIKEYSLENGEAVDKSKLIYAGRGEEKYMRARELVVRATHETFIEYKGGILLIERDNFPAKGELWCVGGGIERGVPFEESLRKIVLRECNLNIKNLKFLGIARDFWNENPWSSEKGIDDISLVYFAKGEGEVNLDNLHKDPIILKPEDYTEEFRSKLHPHIRDFLDKSIEIIKNH